MNRILIDPAELGPDRAAILADRRAEHIRGVLKARPGDRLRIGLIDGPLGIGIVTALDAGRVELACEFESALPPAPPPLDLLLALPRPKVMKRLWSVLAQFSVRRVGLVNAEKVERPYFDSHVLEPAFVREHLLEGCEQVGATRLPVVSVHRRFKPFVEDELAAWSPGTRRILAHPGAPSILKEAAAGSSEGLLLAVGPEGGWNDFERELLAAHGFGIAGLAGGPLRTDVACVALLALARECQTGS
jgi:RsmE family RNA methyltransferase